MIDPFGRKISYLRVSVTDRCNYRCDYCMPKRGYHPEGNHKEYLSFDELTRVCNAFVELGTDRIRITGGEPLVRKQLDTFIAQLKMNAKIIDIAMSTNAHHLVQHAEKLKIAGLSRVNVSLDSLDREQFKVITRGGDLDKVLAGIKAASNAGLCPIKLNMVVMKGINFNQIPAMLDFAISMGAMLRFIELMPIGKSGIERMDLHVSAEDIKNEVKRHLHADLIPSTQVEGGGPATYFKVNNSELKTHTKIGIISAVSQHFCQSCNRVRLNARGRLILCLGQENSVDLRHHLRTNISDDGLKNIIIEAIKHKPERHFFNENVHNIEFREMSSLGG